MEGFIEDQAFSPSYDLAPPPPPPAYSRKQARPAKPRKRDKLGESLVLHNHSILSGPYTRVKNTYTVHKRHSAGLLLGLTGPQSFCNSAKRGWGEGGRGLSANLFAVVRERLACHLNI
jgi:hypothetical protein